MSAKKVGSLIKEARTNAGLTQEQLAKKVKGLSAADISKAERGEKTLTQDQLKAIAKAAGVTQKSLLDAAKSTSSSSSTSTSSSSSSKNSMKLSAAEKKLVQLYRKADQKTKNSVMELLEKEESSSGSILSELAQSASGSAGSILSGLTGGSSNNSSGSLLGTILSGAASALGKREMPEGEGE